MTTQPGDEVVVMHPYGGDQRRKVAKVEQVIPFGGEHPFLVVAGRLFARIRGEYVGETIEGSPLFLLHTGAGRRLGC